MAHADDATKEWISAIPKKNDDGHVIEWTVQYKYTLAVAGKDDFVREFEKNRKNCRYHHHHNFRRHIVPFDRP